uniref:Secreted protein n=1 Tax=Parastrongyloides trichosuri TaxID=131310 RepID=A0A0N5A6V5_PARTI
MKIQFLVIFVFALFLTVGSTSLTIKSYAHVTDEGPNAYPRYRYGSKYFNNINEVETYLKTMNDQTYDIKKIEEKGDEYGDTKITYELTPTGK